MTARTQTKRKTGVGKGLIRLGRHDETALEAMYRMGGLTREQLQTLLPVGASVTRQALRRLRANGLVDETVDVAAWQERAHLGGTPRSYYFLSSRYGGVGVEYGAYLAGIEKKRDALTGYKRHQLPARAAHSSIRNSYLLQLAQEVAQTPDVDAPLEEMWGESHPTFPLKSGRVSGRDPGRKNARKLYRDLYPDGLFEVIFSSGEDGPVSCTGMLEVETHVRSAKLRSKVNDYAGWMERVKVVRPLIILVRTEAHAASCLRALDLDELARMSYWPAWTENLGVLGAKAGYPGDYPGLQEGEYAPGPGELAAADLVLISSYEEIEARGALSDVYISISGREVDLRAIAGRAQEVHSLLEGPRARLEKKEGVV